MKTAIYIEDGIIQLVITPESEFEKNSLKIFKDKKIKTEIFTGSFYDCRGGWVRQKDCCGNYSNENNEDNSLILKTDTSEDKK